MKHADGIRCVGYARSAVGPVDRQVDEIRRRSGQVELLDVLREPGRSGLSLDRPQLKNLLRMIRRGRVDAVVVARLTALSRSPEHLDHLLDEFEHHDVRLIALAEGIDATTVDGRVRMELARNITRALRSMDARKARTA